MKGLVDHEVSIAQAGEIDANCDSYGGGPFPQLRTERPTVIVVNNDDPHYWQGFENWDELRAFINELEKAGIEAFGASDLALADKQST